jgi:coenzyme F420-0:L-glutamate ligase/coenzyme F420-1:gamma-L-glutamate ligase
MVLKMQVLSVKTPLVWPKDNLVTVILDAIKDQGLELLDNDVLAVSSKIVSFAQNRVVKLNEIKPSRKAKAMAKKYALTPSFAELILREADSVVGGVKKAVLTLNDNVFTVNAGIDNKNSPKGYAVLWPKNPQRTAEHIREEIIRRLGKRVGVLIVDSTVEPLRWGTRGLAIGVAGFEPVKDYRKNRDLFGKDIVITLHAVADDLASAAHLMMGEAAERTPVAIIRDAPLAMAEKIDPDIMKIAFKECVYMGAFKPKPRSTVAK